MEAATLSLDGGFADPVFGAQSTFRAVMDAMARPGTIGEIGDHVAPPAPLGVAAAAIACTLADADTNVWLDAGMARSQTVRDWLTFYSGAPFVDTPERAAIALVAESAAMPALADFNQGTQDYPDRSTTIVVQVEALDGGEALVFAGPGILQRMSITPRGLPAGFAAQWAANRARFPRGIDLVLAAGSRFLCLPRSARLIENEG